MPIYVFESADGDQIEETFSVADCPARIMRGGKRYRKIIAPLAGVSMVPTTNSPEYQAWFHSDAVQAKLKSGEFEIVPKSANVNHY